MISFSLVKRSSSKVKENDVTFFGVARKTRMFCIYRRKKDGASRKKFEPFRPNRPEKNFRLSSKKNRQPPRIFRLTAHRIFFWIFFPNFFASRSLQSGQIAQERLQKFFPNRTRTSCQKILGISSGFFWIFFEHWREIRLALILLQIEN